MFRSDEQLIEIEVGQMQRQHRRERLAVVGDKQAPAPIHLERIRARNFASRKLLAASRPVEAQLSIQTRAISSYSSVRAGRIVGGGIQTVPDSGVAVSGAKKKPPRQYREGFFNSIKCGRSLRSDQARSKRSRFITLVHALTKSFANFSLASALP